MTFPAIARFLDRLRRGPGRTVEPPVPSIRFPLQVGTRRLRRDQRPAHSASSISRPILRRHWLGGMW